jgi:hypothetical protein
MTTSSRRPEHGHSTGLLPNSWPTENEWSSIFSCVTTLKVREISYTAIGNLQITDGRPYANYWWHPALFCNLRVSHWEPRFIVTPALQESIYGLSNNPTTCIWWGLILNKTEVMKCAKGALPHGLLLSSVTARSWGVGIVSLIEERSLLSQHAP